MADNEYDGHWISTFTNKKLHYLKPNPDEICIEDIAHALSLTCRFGGHCSEFYSVAEHSIRVMGIVTVKYKLEALLHDAHEAYLHDVPRPIKQDIPQYKILADNLQEAILTKFDCKTRNSKEVKKADDTMLATEARDLGFDTTDWMGLPPPLLAKIYPYITSIKEIEERFKYKFRQALIL